ncbi:major facilitator superfamily domain-containing protein [Flagelloscypha sp. PMI_526]|nr:major facilitator superfamily domain-containing protein [Flagelloscypha sp. PMI_526]
MARVKSFWKDSAVTLAVSGVTTLNMYLSGALTIAIPTIGRDLGMSQAEMQWPLTVYSLSYGCLLLFFGRVGDIIGPRLMFLLGSAWFGAWSLAAAFAPSSSIFIVFIAMKGIGAAANTPAALGIVVEYFPPGADRNRALGILGAFQPIGWIIGLVLGGALAGSSATWRSIFYIQAGLTLLFGLLGAFCFSTQRKSETRYSKGLDWGGAILSTIGLGLLTYSLADSTSTPLGWGTPRIPATFVASIVVLAAFLYYEHTREKKNVAVLMPLSIWRIPKARMGPLMAVVFFGWWSFNTLMYWFTLFFQEVQMLSPLETAVRFCPLVISGIIVNLVGGMVMSHVRGEILMFVGFMGNVIAPLLFALIDVKASYWTMAFISLIVNAGADLAYPVALLHLSNSFDQDSQSLAGGLFNVGTRMGTALGLAISSSIATAVTKKHSSSQYSAAESLMFGFRAAGWACFAAGVISVIFIVGGLRGMGIVGHRDESNSSKSDPEKGKSGDIEMLPHRPTA